jgi:hypothetical protein
MLTLQQNKFPSPGGTADREKEAANYEKSSYFRSSQLRVYDSTLLCEIQRAYNWNFVLLFYFLQNKFKYCRKGGKGTKLEDSEPRQARDTDAVKIPSPNPYFLF